jgi:hypothetical protein
MNSTNCINEPLPGLDQVFTYPVKERTLFMPETEEIQKPRQSWFAVRGGGKVKHLGA